MITIDNNENNNIRKKGGFTFVEVVAAVAIIAIAGMMLMPNVRKPINKANETKALDDVRQVVLAVENYSLSSENEIKDSESFSDIKDKVNKLNKKEKEEFLNLGAIKTIKNDMTYKTIRELANGEKKFTLQDGKIEVTK